jgi:NADH-quinone oxidoreductase subunit A
MKNDYLLLTIFLGIAIVFPLIPLALAWIWAKLLSPSKPGGDKHSSYECGIDSTGIARIQFQSHYYLYALVFLIFDVETVFLLPFAAAFLHLPPSAFLALMVFLLLLVESLVWAWAKGILAWSKT